MTEERNLFRYLIIKKEKKTKTLSCNGKKKKKKKVSNLYICHNVLLSLYTYTLYTYPFPLEFAVSQGG